MIIKLRGFYVYRNTEGGEGDGGGGASGTEGGAPAGAGGDGSDAGGADAAAASLLASGGAKTDTSATDFIPEKYRVNKEDGSFDLEASSRKLADAHSAAEKRIGAGNLPPKTAEEYAVSVPDAFKEVFDPAADEGFKSFRDGAHKLNFNQEQLDFVMSRYFEMAPQLVQGAAALDEKAATAELQKVWATPADFDKNIRNAFSATSAIAGKAGVSLDAIMSGPLGNNPDFLRLMAVLGPELREDSNPTGDALMTQDDVNDMMNDPAYSDPSHKDHAKVSAKVKAYFERKHGTEAAA